MNFFTHLYHSLWDIEWLAKMKDKPKQSWGYFFLFMFLLVIATFAPIFWKVPGLVREAEVFFDKEVPSFTATFKDGALSVTELPQPYISEKRFEEGENVLIYIDTSTTEALNARELGQTKSTGGVLLVTKDRYEFYDAENSSHQIGTFSVVPDVSFTKQDITSMIDKKGALVVSGALSVAAVILYIFGSAWKLLYLVILGAIITIIVKIAKRNDWKFGEVFRLGLSTIILPSVVLLIAGYIAFKPPFVFTIIFLVLTLSVIFREVKKVEGTAGDHKMGEHTSK